MHTSVVMMGVAGCGKSTLGAAVAHATGMPLVEGDDFHSDANRVKMADGIALTDTDRAGWLQRLAEELQHRPGIVLTCSALKRAYRETLAAASPGLKFVFLDIDRASAKARVEARAATHFFSASLIDSQFDTLESPVGEQGGMACG
jgi:gluconokinase